MSAAVGQQYFFYIRNCYEPCRLVFPVPNINFAITLTPNQVVDITFCIPTFAGNNGNVRVMVAQFAPGVGSSGWGSVVFTPHSVSVSDAICNGNSASKIRMHNTGSSNAVMAAGSVLYLFTVVTD